MDISKNIDNTLQIDAIKLHKMAFLYNALEEGWKIKKKKTCIFLQKITKEKKKFF